jgi:hypothetical protein
LGDALALQVLDERYHYRLQEQHIAMIQQENIPMELALDLSLAGEDRIDRELEVAGAAKLITSLAALDGLVLLNPKLNVLGFGVKIGPGRKVGTVYDGLGFARRGTSAKKVDTSRFGTRHTSMFRYCREDSRAIGVVVSQDGGVRVIMSVANSLTFWENVKLLGDSDFSSGAVASELRYNKERASSTRRRQYGYTDVPKSLASLLRTTMVKRRR